MKKEMLETNNIVSNLVRYLNTLYLKSKKTIIEEKKVKVSS